MTKAAKQHNFLRNTVWKWKLEMSSWIWHCWGPKQWSLKHWSQSKQKQWEGSRSVCWAHEVFPACSAEFAPALFHTNKVCLAGLTEPTAAAGRYLCCNEKNKYLYFFIVPARKVIVCTYSGVFLVIFAIASKPCHVASGWALMRLFGSLFLSSYGLVWLVWWTCSSWWWLAQR